MKQKFLQFILVAICAMLVLAGCGNQANSGNEPTPTNVVEETNTPEASEPADSNEASDLETEYPLTVTDITGTEVVLEEQPDAVVSLVPSETEILFAVGAGELVVGVDEYSNYPAETADIAKVGDMNTNIEAVTALNPDVVFASNSMNGAAIEKLRELGLVVYVSDPLTYDETVAHIEQVGVLLNKQEDANAVADHMQQVKADIEEKVAAVDKRSVYMEFSPGWTFGSGIFLDDLVNIAGGMNVAAGQAGYFEIDSEAVIAQNPEVIIYPDFGEEESSILAGIMSRPGWDVIDAVQNNRMVMVDNDPLVRVGPRLVNGLEDIAAAIHPELFN